MSLRILEVYLFFVWTFIKQTKTTYRHSHNPLIPHPIYPVDQDRTIEKGMGQASVKEFGNQVSRGVKAGKDSIVPVSPLIWGVFPGIAVTIAVVCVLLYLRVSITESMTKTKDEKSKKSNTLSRRYNILWYVAFAPVVGLCVGWGIYSLAFKVANPMWTGAAMVWNSF